MINNWSEGSVSLFTLGWVIIGVNEAIGFRDIAKFGLYVYRCVSFTVKV